MPTPTATDDAIRHRLLEAVLLRLARHGGGDVFVLRGGLLLRHWFRPTPRPADDLDLIALFPFDPARAAEFIPLILAGPGDDGVTFDPEFRTIGMHLQTGSPGVRVFLNGTADGVETDIHIDVTFGPPPRPDPVLADIPIECGAVVRFPVCPPESVAAQKVQALCHLGMLGFRAKDLNDLRLLVDRVPMPDGDLRDAVVTYLDAIGRSPADVADVCGPVGWLRTKFAAGRWLDFARESPDPTVPRDTAGIADRLAARLLPVPEVSP